MPSKRNVPPKTAHTRAKLEHASMDGGQPSNELRLDHAENDLTDAISRVVEKAPPLRPEQVERLAGLLTAGWNDATMRREPA